MKMKIKAVVCHAILGFVSMNAALAQHTVGPNKKEATTFFCPKGLAQAATTTEKGLDLNGHFLSYYMNHTQKSGITIPILSSVAFKWKSSGPTDHRSVSDDCQVKEAGGTKTARELEEAINGYDYLKIQGAAPDMLSQCLPQTMSDADKKTVIEDYYTSMSRLTTQAKANIDTLAGIDTMLGKRADDMLKPSKSGQYVSDPLLPGTEEWNKQVRAKCSTPAITATGHTQEFDDAVQQVMMANAIIKVANAKLKGIPFIKGTTNYSPENQKKVDEIVAGRQAAIDATPWLKGNVMAKYGDVKTNATSEQVTADLMLQLSNNREALIARQQKLISASKCLNSDSYSNQYFGTCANATTETLVNDTQSLPVRSLVKGKDAKSLDVISHLENANDCRIGKKDQGGAKEAYGSAREAIADTEFNIGVTVAMFGLNDVYQAGKLSYEAGRVAQLGKAAWLAHKVVLGADAYYAYTGIRDTRKVCDNDINKNLTGDIATAPDPKGPTCSTKESSQVQAISEYKACYMQAAMAAIQFGAVAGSHFKTFKAAVKNPLAVLDRNANLVNPVDRLVKTGMSESAARAVITDLNKTADNIVAHETATAKTFFGRSGLSQSMRSTTESQRAIHMIDTVAAIKPELLAEGSKSKSAIMESMVHWDDLFHGKIDGKKAGALVNELSEKNGALDGLNVILKDMKTALADGSAKSIDEAFNQAHGKHPEFNTKQWGEVKPCITAVMGK